MRLMVKDGKTDDYVVIEPDGIIEFELLPDTDEEKRDNNFWGLRRSVNGFIKDLKEQAKL